MPTYAPENPYKGIPEFPNPDDLVLQESFENKLLDGAKAILYAYDDEQYDVRVDFTVSVYKKANK